MTAQQVAYLLNVSISTVLSWESDRTSPAADKVIGLAKLYGCTTDELLGLSKEEAVR